MRKFLKKSILEIFQTMYEAHVSIKEMINEKDFENVQVLLEDCQNTAVQIGTTIEASEGEGFVTVGFLEEYCEAVYEVATSISDDYIGNKAQKALDKKLIKAENSLKNDVKVRLEIVFCPYKASMWDSLESVWKAADEDPDCDAYVVPIPYYDRNPDYSFGEFHYEGGDFPDYVPVTHYESYNFEARRPDVIYIHNPYDEYNNVTSVEPRFYSSELKKFTDELVYIPYFILAEPNPDDPSSVEGVAHFAITPGVINSDKVIVQSEAMKQTYIKALLNQFGNNPENRKLLEDKILGTGSPKFDKKSNKSKTDIPIPDTWMKLILKPDESRKKIIMYNTGLSAMLENDYLMLKKIQSVIELFYKNRNEICLLWRPHPLLEATLKSMKPHLYDEYINIKNKYINQNWGIFDDSPNLDRAVLISDGYYGDYSSVAHLCENCKIKVLYQNTEINT
ncbi:MAG: hypothetical protein ACI4KF_07205 [Huintestinicola sp.]